MFAVIVSKFRLWMSRLSIHRASLALITRVIPIDDHPGLILAECIRLESVRLLMKRSRDPRVLHLLTEFREKLESLPLPELPSPRKEIVKDIHAYLTAVLVLGARKEVLADENYKYIAKESLIAADTILKHSPLARSLRRTDGDVRK
jgi:hypothetical protein